MAGSTGTLRRPVSRYELTVLLQDHRERHERALADLAALPDRDDPILHHLRLTIETVRRAAERRVRMLEDILSKTA